MTTNSTDVPTTQGWTSSPTTRGTFDILQSCILTISLCIWTSVLPNVPKPSSSPWSRLRPKFQLTLIGILGPEFLLVIASGQFSSALRATESFKSVSRAPKWTMTHSFFADMGGFVLKSPDFETFPVDAAQLLWLVQNGYVEYPGVDEDDIKDKNKADTLARSIATLQAIWFTISTIFRAIQGFSITTLELTVLSFILMMFITSYLWHHKPADVTRPIVLETSTPIAEILDRAGRPPQELESYRWTPLDFISRQEWPLSLLWASYIHVLHHCRIPLHTWDFAKPAKRIPDDKLLQVTQFRVKVAMGVSFFAFMTFFVIGWNFHFPTHAERLLWRVSSIYFIVYGAVGDLYIWAWVEYGLWKEGKGILPKLFRGRTLALVAQDTEMVRDTEIPDCTSNATETRDKREKSGVLGRVDRSLDPLRNLSPDKDPQLAIPLRLWVLPTVLSVLYCFARFYILVEDFVGLRSLPVDAFTTVEWSVYVPHL